MTTGRRPVSPTPGGKGSGHRRGGEGVLVVAPAWIGDLVMTQSLVGVLRARRPERRIDLLAPPWSQSLVERMPDVDGFVADPVGHGNLELSVRWRIARRLRGGRYGQAVVVKRSFKAALIPWLAGIPRRTGVLGEVRYGLVNDRRAPDPERHPLWVHRMALLGQDPGERPLTPEEVPRPRLRPRPKRVPEVVERLDLGPGSDAVALAPGAAYGPSKRWPLDRWTRLARRLSNEGREVWILGGPGEGSSGRRIVEGSGRRRLVRDLTGRTELGEVVDLFSRCSVLVTHDSGLMHIGAAVGLPVVALYGSSDPGYTPPLTERRTVFWRALPCSPCFERVCPLGHHACMEGIPVERVLEAIG